eukprot:TRINITY_DN38522_c0_g1_i1.p1 TRINITY_DN38522_c0_g1~~TRINITY_DN38522_c0_g1_i1.p1  ORF type:complete len:128 (+),score=3.30 TRINITY_DN38522_c0_g1_i1:39-386(+)
MCIRDRSTWAQAVCLFLSKQRKNGAPIKEITMLTEISPIGKIMRPNVSHITTSEYPNAIEVGKRYLQSEPTSNLAICGIINPTKFIRPETDIAAPANNEEIAIKKKSKALCSNTQ